MITRSRTQSKNSSQPSRAGIPFLQRKCACGGAQVFDSECSNCRKKKLRLQRQALDQNEPAMAPAIVEDALRSPGQPLDKDTRSFIGSRLGHDFSRLRIESVAPPTYGTARGISQPEDAHEQQADQIADELTGLSRHSAAPAPQQDSFLPDLDDYLGRVRIHTMPQAAESASAVDALAYTVGADIVFGEGQYAPETFMGRRLLAHELIHVIQQAMSAVGDLGSTRIHRQPVPAPEALKKALKGDDDDVRDLTKSSIWSSLDLSARNAKVLIIHLLDGYTGDDDELAGLTILRKNVTQQRLDDTLQELDNDGRFGQLFDDFDGAEYVKLLDLLSENIERYYIKKIFLDKLIKEDRINKDEEKAVVTALAKAPQSHAWELLGQNNREEYFRSKIDNKKLAVWYEKVVANANEQRRTELKEKTKWRLIFDDEAKKCRKPGLSDAEAERIFQADMKELSDELAKEIDEYQMNIMEMAVLSHDPVKSAEVNRKFEKSINEFLARKRVEFCLELKFDKEFSLSLNTLYRTNWTLSELKTMQLILSRFPPEILEANPKFKGFIKESEHGDEPWLGGFTTDESITLVQPASSVIAHEFGHVVHNADPKLLEEFQKLSGWEEADTNLIAALKAKNSNFQKVLDSLDEKRKNKAAEPNIATTSETYEGYRYLYNRYGSGYFRYPLPHPKGAAFVTEYAATHPKDDFAETFQWYVNKPDNLRGNEFIKKYTFMHVEVFVKLIFRAKRDVLVNKFIDKKDGIIKEVTSKGSLDSTADTKIFEPMRDQMIKDMDSTLQPSVDAAQAHLEKARPKADMTQAEAVLQTYLSRLDTISWFIKDASARVMAFDSKLMSHSKTEIADSLEAMARGLDRTYANDLIKLIEKQAQALATGATVKTGAWPEADALVSQYDKSISVIDPYLLFLNRVNKVTSELDNFEAAHIFDDDELMDKLKWTTIGKFPLNNPHRKEVINEVFNHLRPSRSKLSAIKKAISLNVQQGVPLKQARLDRPEDILSGIEKDMKNFAKTLK